MSSEIYCALRKVRELLLLRMPSLTAVNSSTPISTVMPKINSIDTSNGVRLRTVTWGTRETHQQKPIVLVHGLASNAMLWEGAALALCALGHLVTAVDLRGHGLSDKPETGYDMQTVTQDLAGLLREIQQDGFTQPVVCGQSWGGNVVLELAHTHAELTSGVVCVDGGFLELQNHYPQWDDCAKALRPPKIAGTKIADFRNYMQRAHPDWPETGINGALACMEHLPDGTLRPWLSLERHMMVLRGLWEHHPTQIYSQISLPVMFVPAEGPSGIFNETKRSAIEHATQLVPKVKVEWFSPADHDLHAQHPERFAQVVHAAITDGFF
jgi:pimeloyl-ACP methyl ester carboxylesterase